MDVSKKIKEKFNALHKQAELELAQAKEAVNFYSGLYSLAEALQVEAAYAWFKDVEDFSEERFLEYTNYFVKEYIKCQLPHSTSRTNETEYFAKLEAMRLMVRICIRTYNIYYETFPEPYRTVYREIGIYNL